MRTWYSKNAARVKGNYRNRTQELRLELVLELGGKCAWPGCNWDDARALQLDHIHGGGQAERKAAGCNSGYNAQYLRRILADPLKAEKFQVLCANHNWVKRFENKELGTGNKSGRPKKYLI